MGVPPVKLHEKGRGARTLAQCHLVFEAWQLSKTFNKGYVLDMDFTEIFNLYLQLAPAELFRLVQREAGVIVHNGIYSAPLLIWMMMNHRFQCRGTPANSGETLFH